MHLVSFPRLLSSLDFSRYIYSNSWCMRNANITLCEFNFYIKTRACIPIRLGNGPGNEKRGASVRSGTSMFALWITVAEIKSLLLVLYVCRIIGSRAGITYCRSAMSISAGWEANKLPRFYGNRAPTCASLSRDLWNQLLRIIKYYFYLRNLSFFLFSSEITTNSRRYFLIYLLQMLSRL